VKFLGLHRNPQPLHNHTVRLVTHRVHPVGRRSWARTSGTSLVTCPHAF
jgi:hypothetical protein